VNTGSLEHIPVLSHELLEQISLPQDAVMVDATIGHGGHGLLFGEHLGPAGTIFGLDVDEKCIYRAQRNLAGLACKVILVRANFAQLEQELGKKGIGKVDLILADLGVCSAQIADVERGLSFQENMPLDMRLDRRLKTTAADIVNTASEKDLADLIYKYSQERASRRIARFIVNHRRAGRITSTAGLAQIVCQALGQGAKGRRSKIHPATRTFQALRIAVNDEVEKLKALLNLAPKLLKTNGCVAVIAFHSVEDRIVKNNFKKNAADGVYKILTAKPLTASRAEIEANPRARSAKLRIAQKS